MKSFPKIPHVLHKDILPYLEALALQESLHGRRVRGEIADTLILLEHPPVFTTGRQDVAQDWLLSQAQIREKGIEVVATSRGGRITYHGPGQLVGYFICDLRGLGMGVADFVHGVEDGIIQIVRGYGIDARRDAHHPGVWVGDHKLAAIGLHVKQGVTLHGFALNVTTDLTPYQYCIPCGIQGKGVTSLHHLQPERRWTVYDVSHDIDAYFCSMAAKVGSPEPSMDSSVNITHSSA